MTNPAILKKALEKGAGLRIGTNWKLIVSAPSADRTHCRCGCDAADASPTLKKPRNG